jgi:hypothetical protein
MFGLASNGRKLSNFLKIGQLITKLKAGNTDTHREHNDFISLLFPCREGNVPIRDK